MTQLQASFALSAAKGLTRRIAIKPFGFASGRTVPVHHG